MAEGDGTAVSVGNGQKNELEGAPMTLHQGGDPMRALRRQRSRIKRKRPPWTGTL